ncbi:exopolyphosphatase [Phreatobacter sp. AB_2022a]|uniref:exopolyphosphatase n=1 Tax=Phreatobacter sp. AB_2022a TaxID=3003134 RepID=UPI002286EEB4|nr:exopolyphosphatase [Phreatobacter sp. AB_2022a]MCZ0735359.1 exopolyphosphatase [Phreatobacter sp. AB_2022a]
MERADFFEIAPGRLQLGPTIAVIDIGSNSVRLVVYEALTRSPTPIFNEKALCGLGRNVLTSGRLADEAVARALASIRRFRVLCTQLNVGELHVLATAAVRDAKNGPDFVAECEAICGVPLRLLSGREEATFAALGVVSGTYQPDGIVGDLGGGSLELVDIKGERIGGGVTLPLGGLALQDTSGYSVKKAERIAAKTIGKVELLKKGKGRTFYAVGGTWRSLARLHMAQRGYPLNVMHGYSLSGKEIADFCYLVSRQPTDTISRIEVVAESRRPLLAYGALVLEAVVRAAKVDTVVVSVLGVREGLLFSMLDDEQRAHDPLLSAARELSLLRSRSPRHGEELIDWTDRFMEVCHLEETAEERRLRHAACLLADIGWRAHPDYRGEQSLNIIAHANFSGVDHPGRAYLALAIYYRHEGIVDEFMSPRIRELVGVRLLDRARVLGAAMRVAYLISAAMPGVLPRAPLTLEDRRLVLTLAGDLSGLSGERLVNRLRTLGRMVGRETELRSMP